MDIKSGLFTYLMSKTDLTTLIVTRLYPDQAPQSVTQPYVTYEVQDTEHMNHLLGASALADYMITFTVNASSSESRDSVKEALRNILHTRSNITLATGSIQMRSATLQGVHDSKVDPVDGSETSLFQCEMDFRVIFFETAPTLP